jgi:ribosomal protein L15
MGKTATRGGKGQTARSGYTEKRGATNAIKKLKDWASTTEILDSTVKVDPKKK